MKYKYIHYGHENFDINKFNKIENIPYFTKPKGGLWASMKYSKFSWKDWCIQEDFYKHDLHNYFEFNINKNAKILQIDNSEDLDKIKSYKYTAKFEDKILEHYINNTKGIILNFERLQRIYDAIEVNISNDSRLYNILYGWDCDSILIMNPDIIIL